MRGTFTSRRYLPTTVTRKQHTTQHNTTPYGLVVEEMFVHTYVAKGTHSMTADRKLKNMYGTGEKKNKSNVCMYVCLGLEVTISQLYRTEARR